jgi:hypothetical protein
VTQSQAPYTRGWENGGHRVKICTSLSYVAMHLRLSVLRTWVNIAILGRVHYWTWPSIVMMRCCRLAMCHIGAWVCAVSSISSKLWNMCTHFFLLSRVGVVRVINNYGFQIGWLDLLTLLCTISLNYNQYSAIADLHFPVHRCARIRILRFH